MLKQAFKCVTTYNLTANSPKKNLKVGFIVCVCVCVCLCVCANDAPKFTN